MILIKIKRYDFLLIFFAERRNPAFDISKNIKPEIKFLCGSAVISPNNIVHKVFIHRDAERKTRHFCLRSRLIIHEATENDSLHERRRREKNKTSRGG